MHSNFVFHKHVVHEYDVTSVKDKPTEKNSTFLAAVAEGEIRATTNSAH